MIEASDTGSAETGREGRGRDFWPTDKPGRKLPSPKLLLGAGAALVAVVVAVVAVLVFTGGEDEPAVVKTAAPTAFTPDFNGSGFAEIADRSADARQITEGEATSAKELTGGAYSFKLAASDLTGDCKSATWGARLQGDLAKFGCTQIARSAYVSGDKKHVGMFIVINMKDMKGVQQILRDLQRETNAGWVTPLKVPGVPAFASGVSAAYAKTYGHYAVITWVERAGGGKATLNELIDVSLVIEGAADYLYGRLDLASGSGNGQ